MRAAACLTAAAVVAVAETYRRGYCWPILTTLLALRGRRPCNEADWPA